MLGRVWLISVRFDASYDWLCYIHSAATILTPLASRRHIAAEMQAAPGFKPSG